MALLQSLVSRRCASTYSIEMTETHLFRRVSLINGRK